MRAIERLSPQDLITLWPDDVGWLQDVGVLAVLDGDLGGCLDAVRAGVAARLHLAPRLRQVVQVPPPGCGRPLWADFADLDLRRHVQVCPLPAPGVESQLLATVEHLRRRRLDPARPLWELWLLPGLQGGRTGYYLRLHHAVADGTAAVALLRAAFLDVAPAAEIAPAGEVAPPQALPWTPQPPPTRRDLVVENLSRHGAALRRAGAVLAHPGQVGRCANGVASSVHGAATAPRAPRSSLNRPIGRDRRLAVVRSDLARVEHAAHHHGATVNDVVLQAIVPVSLARGPGEHRDGNVLGQMVVPLPVGVSDPGRRLELIAAETVGRKRRASPRRPPVLRSRTLQRAAMVLLARQRLYNVYVADVPGPRVPLYVAGARVLEVFPVAPLMGNLTLGVGALSYAGELTAMAVGDRVTCPDLDVFAAGLDAGLRVLAG